MKDLLVALGPAQLHLRAERWGKKPAVMNRLTGPTGASATASLAGLCSSSVHHCGPALLHDHVAVLPAPHR